MVAGVGLRVWQYLANSSLFVDEAALARNIIDRSPTALFRGLDYAQTAPLGFLLVQKGIVTLLGTSEYALRAWPLGCGLLALVLFWSVAKRVLSGWAVTFAVGLFSLGTPFIYFSSLVKQYSSDVAVAILLLLVSIEIRRRGVTSKSAWLFGGIGAVAVWLSQPAVFILSGIAAGFIILVLRERDRAAAQRLIATGILWGLSAAGAAIFALRHLSATDQEFFRWSWADDFMPMPPQNPSDLLWMFNRLTWMFGRFGSGMGHTHGGLNYPWSLVFTVVTLAGLWALWKTRRDVALFLLLPIAFVATMSAAEIYPFSARLIVFLTPSLLLATAAGADYLLTAWPTRLKFLVPGSLAVLGGAPIYAAATSLPPYWLQHIRPVIEHVNAFRLPGDGVYVYYGAGQAFRYYANRYNLSMDDIVIGRCHAGDPREYLRELDRFRGKRRLWFVVTTSWREGTEVALMLEYLDRLGRRLETISVPGSGGYVVEAASGYSYDLSDLNRLDAVSSSTFPIRPGRATEPPGPWSCYGIFRTDPKSH